MPKLEEIIELAKGAGEILLSGFGSEHQLELKGAINPVTEIDKLSETYLIERISDNFIGHQIIAEESGQIGKTSEICWYIDPLDGTTNYACGYPYFAVSIAVSVKSQILFGVVYDPYHKECFYAQKEGGAFLNGKPIKTSTVKHLNESVLVTGFPYDRAENQDNNLEIFNRITPLIRGIRRSGSAALDLCYVAANRLSGYWEIRIEPWDFAAGQLIASEAGAVVSKRNGEFDLFKAPFSIVCANKELHKEMLRIIHPS